MDKVTRYKEYIYKQAQENASYEIRLSKDKGYKGPNKRHSIYSDIDELGYAISRPMKGTKDIALSELYINEDVASQGLSKRLIENVKNTYPSNNIVLRANPYKHKKLDKKQLEDYYLRQGFEFMDDGRMVYKQAALNEDVEFNALQKRIVDNPNNSMIIAHPVGSGKTLSGIAKFEKLKEQEKAKKALVITPAGLRHNFANEGVSKFTDSSVNIIGNKGEIKKKTGFNPNPDSDYNVISYEMFRRDPKRYIKETGADTVILDEIHRLKNEGTSTLDGFNEIKGDYNNFIGLTGSVISNKISDIYNLIDLSSQGKHELGDNKTNFEDKFYKRSTNPAYKGLHKSRIPVIGFKNIGVLKKDLSNYVDYADIDEVRDISKIPDKIIKVKKVPLSKEQSTYYKKLVKNDPKLRELIQKKRLETMKDDEVARAYSQLAEARKIVNSVGSVVPGINLQESIDRSPKTKLLLDDLEKHLQATPDGQAIIMSHLINGGADILEAGLKEKGLDYGKFIGKGNKGVTEATRQQDIEDYKNRLKRVMLISGAGGEGISLGDTTWEGVLDGHYNPEKMNQMEARGIRAHGLSGRPENERKVLVNRYIATMPKALGVIPSSMKTPDEIIYEIAERKDMQNQLMYNLLKKNQKKQRT